MSDPHTLINIAPASPEKTLSKAQKQFNNLLKKIEQQKQELLEWQDTVPLYQQKICGEFQVVWDEYQQQRVELVYLLDKAYDNKEYNKTERNKIKHILVELADELLYEQGKVELKEIHHKHTGADYDADQEEMDAATGEMMKSLIGNMFGIDVGEDVDLSSPEKAHAFMQEKMQEAQQKQTEQQRQAEEKRAKRKKTQKQLDKEAKQQQEAQNISQSIREVYRKLAAALHPDREPDAEERERKTKLMQRVNAAYEKKSLLDLLSLQLEVEQIDQAHLNNIAEDRLKYFIKILKDQALELEQEVMFFRQQFNAMMQRPMFAKLSPKAIMAALDQDIRGLRAESAGLKAELKMFRDVKSCKLFLKAYKIPKKRPQDDFDDFLGDFFRPDDGFPFR